MADVSIGDCERFVARLFALGSYAELEASGLAGDACDLTRVARDLAPLWSAPGVRITETLVNGARVDVRVVAGDGREWLAVLWVAGASPAITLSDVNVYQRPLPFRGDGPGTVVVLNGPSSVGKSALMAAFAAAASTPWACVDEP